MSQRIAVHLLGKVERLYSTLVVSRLLVHESDLSLVTLGNLPTGDTHVIGDESLRTDISVGEFILYVRYLILCRVWEASDQVVSRTSQRILLANVNVILQSLPLHLLRDISIKTSSNRLPLHILISIISALPDILQLSLILLLILQLLLDVDCVTCVIVVIIDCPVRLSLGCQQLGLPRIP